MLLGTLIGKSLHDDFGISAYQARWKIWSSKGIGQTAPCFLDRDGSLPDNNFPNRHLEGGMQLHRLTI
jgi:hypothetical protein